MKKDNEFTLWLGICVLIGLFIWQMPNIERLLFGRAKKDKTEVVKEESKEEQTTIKSGRVTCGMTGDNNETIEYRISYDDSKATKVIMITNKVYDSKTTEYNTKVEECNNIATKYANQVGFDATCTINNLVISNQFTFDLSKFKKFTLNNSDNTTEEISIDISYNENIDDVIKKYQAKGATCK